MSSKDTKAATASPATPAKQTAPAAAAGSAAAIPAATTASAAAPASAASPSKSQVTVEDEPADEKSDVKKAPTSAAQEKDGSEKPAAGKGAASGEPAKTGRFAAEKSRLQRALHAHAVGRNLSDRPAAAELHQSGILEQAHVAPSLAQKAKALNREILANNLNQKLWQRETSGGAEEHEHLFRANTVAPRLRNAKVALEHAIRRDRVGQRLEIRPDAAVLLQQGILASPVSARLQGVQRQLQKRFTGDLVAHLLEQRSNIAELAKEGVLRDVRVAPKLQGVQRTLEHNLAKSNLHHALQARPSVQELAQRGIWQPASDDEYAAALVYGDGYGSEDYAAGPSGSDDEDAYEQARLRAYYEQQQQYGLRDYSESPMSPSSAANYAANASFAQNPNQSPTTTARFAGMAAAEAAYRAYQQAALEQQQQDAWAQQQQQAQYAYGAQSPLSPSSSERAYWQQQEAAAYQQHQNRLQQQASDVYAAASSSQRRSKNFHLTRVLLKACVSLGESGALSSAAKSALKELIVDQHPQVYAAAEQFDNDNDLARFRDTLVLFAHAR